MDTKKHTKNAIKWQERGTECKTDILRQFLNLTILTIGFAASILWICGCKCSIIKENICIGGIYMLSIVGFLVSLYSIFQTFEKLKNILYEYSQIHSQLAVYAANDNEKEYTEKVNVGFSHIDTLHKNYEKSLKTTRLIYVISLILLITSIVLHNYFNNCNYQ